MEMEKTLQRISDLLDYNKDTGVFVWKQNRGGKTKAGSVAGCVTAAGYSQIYVDGKPYYGHFLAYFLTNGKLPVDKIDHINRIRTDNRISNLRLADSKLNAVNNSRRGTHLSRNGWVAGITVNGRRKHLGYFKTEEEAFTVYVKAKQHRIHELEKDVQRKYGND
jgi:hypothetical protein